MDVSFSQVSMLRVLNITDIEKKNKQSAFITEFLGCFQLDVLV